MKRYVRISKINFNRRKLTTSLGGKFYFNEESFYSLQKVFEAIVENREVEITINNATDAITFFSEVV